MSHSKGELTADKQIQYLIQWFVEFSSFQRQDFLNDYLEPIYSGFFQKCSHIESKPVQNGEDGESVSPTETNGLEIEQNSDEKVETDAAEAESLANGLNNLDVSSTRPPSIFECRMKLFKQWFSDQWNDQDRVKFLLGLKNVDNDFVSELCKLLMCKDRINLDHENVARLIDPEKSTESDKKNLEELLNTFNNARDSCCSPNSTSDLIETNGPQQQQQKHIPDLLANCQNHQPTETDEDEEEEKQQQQQLNDVQTLDSSLQNECESQNDEDQPRPEI